jgi:hypothetical protein
MKFPAMSLTCVVCLACGSAQQPAPDSGTQAVPDGGVVYTDAGTISSITLAATYTIAAGTENYQCFRTTVHVPGGTQYINAYTPNMVSGTHHIVLFIDTTPTLPDGVSDCAGAFTGLGQTLTYAAGRGATPLNFPASVGFPFQDGDQFVLQVHEFNATTSAITATSTLDVGFTPDNTNITKAQVTLVGNNTFTIPANTMGYTVQGQCSLIPQNSNVFAVFPHMHEIGMTISATLGTSGGNQSLFDVQVWQFAEQPNFFFTPPLSVASGGLEQVTCTYDNTSSMPVKYGSSTTDEMCYAITYLYPASTAVPDICTK